MQKDWNAHVLQNQYKDNKCLFWEVQDMQQQSLEIQN